MGRIGGSTVKFVSMTTMFSINFDYRCPFARNANEHVIAALRAGANYDVSFKAFSLTEVHNEEGTASSFDDSEKRPDILPLEAGVVVRERFPEKFFDVHLSLFAVRHDDGDDLRDRSKIENALTRAGVDAAAVFAEIEQGWPIETVRKEHERSVSENAAFGVPTFIWKDQAVFVRIMTRPAADGTLARSTIDRVLELIENHPDINEYKHTTIDR